MSLDLEAIEARAKAATPGPWCSSLQDQPHTGWMVSNWRVVRDGVKWLAVLSCSPEEYDRRAESNYAARGLCSSDEEDAVFITHAREDVPALVAEVRRLREALREIGAHGVYESEGAVALKLGKLAREALGVSEPRWTECPRCHAILCESPTEPQATNHDRHAEVCCEPLASMPWEPRENHIRRGILPNLRASLRETPPEVGREELRAWTRPRQGRMFDDVRDELARDLRARLDQGATPLEAIDAEFEALEAKP